jgi:hypothetical protein
MKPFKHFYSKVIGVNRNNSDGTPRQQIIGKCHGADRLLLEHDVNNALSDFAVKVLTESGEQLGLIKDLLAEKILNRLKKGTRFFVFISEIVDIADPKPHKGVNLLIMQGEAGSEDFMAQGEAFKLLRDKLGPFLLTFKCEDCGCEMEIEDSMEGQWVDCSECGQEVQVPRL